MEREDLSHKLSYAVNPEVMHKTSLSTSKMTLRVSPQSWTEENEELCRAPHNERRS
jgi:hypothetical protein